ncbi:hypothetical protein [Helicobacter brantae]|uniref:Uncharacterized protein n=1 Tax=Helicobacter brantae TaxID=375927 RepID=A0A3D8IX33_9HELI|nr:hypothetical protein [Helicobacter brantae]RDU69131.1 hypothetical protein CQA58_07590 [Helicobacter brantae]
MSLVSILFMGAMFASCALMAYKKAIKGVVIVFALVAYIAFAFWNHPNSEISGGVFIFFPALFVLAFFLYKKYSSQCFDIVFFALPWVITARTMGFPNSPDFGEKGLGIFAISGFCGVFSLWLLFLKYHQKTYQKILFYFFSLNLLFLLLSFYLSILEDSFLDIFPKKIAEWLLLVDIAIAFVFSPIAYAFFYFGEFILFFLLYYQLFLKDSKNPNPPNPLV